jgi:peptidase M23-like protein
MATSHARPSGRARFTCAIAVAIAAAALSHCNAFVAQARAAASGTGAAPAYGWPVKPFHRQHPVRAFFGDPRIGGRSHSFHFGVDVSCPDGTPIYATITGRAYISPRHPETVSVIAEHGNVEFGYWHVVPTVESGARVTAYRTVIGRVVESWEHVHFAERRNGVYVNPLRPGAMGPFADTTVPTVRAVVARSVGAAPPGATVHGRVDLVAEAYDETPISIAGPWHDKPLTPALLQWRILDGKRVVVGWRTAVDFRRTYPSNDLWSRTYTSWTRQNKKIWDGRYGFYLAHGFDTRRLHDGTYRVQVRATDIRGNSGTKAFPVTVANAA